MPSELSLRARIGLLARRLALVLLFAMVMVPLALTVSGCGESASQIGCIKAGSTRIGEAAHRIRNGTCVTSGFDYVVRMAISVGGGGVSLCSGTLIAPNVVLSAGHCVNPAASNPPFTVTAIQIAIPNLGPSVGAYVTHYRFTGGGSGQPLDTTPDFSVLRLDRNLTPMPVNLASSDLSVGTPMVALGYGYDGTGADGNGKLGDLLSGLVTLNFPGSSSKNVYTLATVQPISSASSQDTCAGDSGGPLFALNATNVIVGVLSGGNYEGSDTCKNSADSYWTSVRWNASTISSWRTIATTTITSNTDPAPSGWTKL